VHIVKVPGHSALEWLFTDRDFRVIRNWPRRVVSNQSLLERAFHLAGDPKIRNVTDIARQLVREGYSVRAVSQLSGFALAKQLTCRIRAARENARVDNQVSVVASNGDRKEHTAIFLG